MHTMRYFVDLFSPETCETFSRSDQSVSGFRRCHETKEISENIYVDLVKLGT